MSVQAGNIGYRVRRADEPSEQIKSTEVELKNYIVGPPKGIPKVYYNKNNLICTNTISYPSYLRKNFID